MGSSAWRIAADGIARRCGAGLATAVVGAAAWRTGQGGCTAGGGLPDLRETARRSRRLAVSAARRTRSAARGTAIRAGWTRHTPAATRRRRVGAQYAVGTLAVAGAGFVRARSHRHRPAAAPPRGGTAGTALAVTTVWLALVAPGQYSVWGIQDFLRLPVAAIGLGAAGLLLPWPTLRILGAGFGAVLAALVMVRGLNLGFRKVMTRPFDITNDWTYLRDGVETLATFAGRAAAVGAVVGAVTVTTAVCALVPWASLRMASAIGRHPDRALPAVVGAAAV